jgi:predicted dehydrogenase
VDSVIVAAPIHTHYELAQAALLAGKHVLVEKSLMAFLAEALELMQIAEEQERVLMVGHTFLFSIGAFTCG